MPNKKIFIIAGEVSGDCLGARIMCTTPNAEFVGIGGENMIAAGLKPIFPMADLAVMGVIEVLAHAKTLTKRIKQTIDAIIRERPDLVLTIDSPGFAKSVVSGLKKTHAGQELIKKGLRFHHVVAPQVWAWRPKRAKKIAATFDKLYAFFDFEVPYFTKYGLETIAVGHPIAENIIKHQHTNKIPHSKIITFIPGSRMTEVKKLLPLFHNVMEMIHNCGYKNFKFVIPTVETTDKYIRSQISTWNIKPEIVTSEHRYDTYSNTYIAIAASGTVSVELAMMHIPAIIVYKMNPLTFLIARLLIRIRWVSLVNILLNRSIYPELLGSNATTNNIMNEFCKLLIPATREKMISELQTADKMWRKNSTDASQIIAKNILI